MGLVSATIVRYAQATFLDDDELMTQVSQFADIDPPVLLWHAGGKFAQLFRFLAVRFLACPDHVLDAEGVHARWKWISMIKRGVSFPMLNAILKVNSYLEQNGGAFPSFTSTEGIRFIELFLEVRRGHNAALRQLYSGAAGTDIAHGAMKKSLYMRRFNLSPLDVDLLKIAALGDAAAEAAKSTPELAWANYIRAVLEPNAFYRFLGLPSDVYLFVGRTRAAPGKRKNAPDESQARSIAYLWFAPDSAATRDGDDGTRLLVQPVEGVLGQLILKAGTPAEILTAAGAFPTIAVDDTERDVELKQEASFMRYELVRYTSVRVGTEGMPWHYYLSDPVDAEVVYFHFRDAADITKMCLARTIQIRDGLTDAQRTLAWGAPRDVLLAAVATDVSVEDATAAAAAARARGRGAARGGGRGRGRGRG